MGEPTGIGLRRVLANLEEYVVVIDRELRYRWFNRMDPTLDEDALSGRGVRDFVTPETFLIAQAAIERAFASGEETEYEAKGYSEGSLTALYRTRVVPITADDGSERAVLISRDVTEAHLALEALAASEERFRRLVEGSPDYVMLLGRDLRITYFNREPAPDTGWTREEILGRRADAVCPPEDAAAVREHLARALETGRLVRFEGYTDGGYGPFVNRVMRIDADQLLVVSTDVSEERAQARERADLHAQLEHAQKMETVGNLAGGVAHDFNNLLLVVRVQLDLARAMYEDGDDPRGELEGARETVDRMQNLTSRLLAVGRRQPSRPKRLDLVEHVAQTMRLVRRTMPGSVHVVVELPDAPLYVVADPSQLEQVLLNLCFNARDAIDGMGSVSLEVRPGEQGTRAWVTVTDDGLGMDEPTLARALDPFFTTKPAGRGTGLGLPMVQGLIESHGGQLELVSAPGEGTTVTFWLPAVDALDEVPTNDEPESTAPPRGEETILIAEDDALVRHNVGRLLRRAGYQVMEASDGQQAVDRFREWREVIDLVLLDVVLPVRSGHEVFEELRRLDPSAPIVLTSGYSTSVVDSTWIDEHGVVMLAKPYTIRTLLEAIREQLDARG